MQILEKIKDEYSHSDSGLFAVALSRITPMPILVIRAEGLPVHICCKLSEKYIDSYGVSTKDQILKRTCHGMTGLKFELAPESAVQNLGKFSDDAILKALPFAQKILELANINFTN